MKKLFRWLFGTKGKDTPIADSLERGYAAGEWPPSPGIYRVERPIDLSFTPDEQAAHDEQAFSAVLCRANSAESMWHKCRDELSAVKANVEKLRAALILARDAHGVMLMTDPPQEAWKARRVDEVIRDALAAQPGAQNDGERSLGSAVDYMRRRAHLGTGTIRTSDDRTKNKEQP